MNRFQKIISIISAVISLGILGALIQAGRVIERLERIEKKVDNHVGEYQKTILFQGFVTRTEYVDLRKMVYDHRAIHIADGDLSGFGDDDD